MIINRSGIVIRLSVKECRLQGRATQGVRLINLAKKNDIIASVCKVMGSELEALIDQTNRESWAKPAGNDQEAESTTEPQADNAVEDNTEGTAPMVDFTDDAPDNA